MTFDVWARDNINYNTRLPQQVKDDLVEMFRKVWAAARADLAQDPSSIIEAVGTLDTWGQPWIDRTVGCPSVRQRLYRRRDLT